MICRFDMEQGSGLGVRLYVNWRLSVLGSRYVRQLVDDPASSSQLYFSIITVNDFLFLDGLAVVPNR